jgi:DNA-binding NarL/FixJ family response regulator
MIIQVLIADDQKLLRESLKSIIEQDPEIKVAGCAGDGLEALEICDQTAIDLILMDIRMPVCDGIEGTKIIKKSHPQIKILVLTTFDDDQNVFKTLLNGADGYILKDVTPDELIQAVKNVAAGFSIFSKKPHQSIINQLSVAGEPGDREEQKDIGLKDREIKIIALIADGKSNREIAAELSLSAGRVKNIISEMLSKLDLKDRQQLVSFAYKKGIVR